MVTRKAIGVRLESFAIDTLDTLDRRLHPKQHVGLRFLCWTFVNAMQSFFSYWRYCYGCGLKDACSCEPGEPAAFVIDARTAWSVALAIWEPRWDARWPIVKPVRPRWARRCARVEFLEFGEQFLNAWLRNDYGPPKVPMNSAGTTG